MLIRLEALELAANVGDSDASDRYGLNYLQARGDGSVVATDAGIAALGSDYEPLPTGAALLDWWRPRLPAGERKVLDVLVAAGGAPLHRESIDQATGFRRSSRDSYLARLSSRRLVVAPGTGSVAASPALFG